MRISIELRRPARRSVALTVGALLLLTPAIVLANHQFNDVPNDHPFHDEISAIAEAGVTAGFDDGGYHPSEAVTRQAMAAFMHRGFSRFGIAMGTAPLTANFDSTLGTLIPVRQLTITVPGASNNFSPSQLVHVQGRIVLFGSMSTAAHGCPCQFNAWVRDVDNNVVNFYAAETFESISSVPNYYSVAFDAIFLAPPGPHTYQAEVTLNYRESEANPASWALDTSSVLTATTFPFGPTGGDEF